MPDDDAHSPLRSAVSNEWEHYFSSSYAKEPPQRLFELLDVILEFKRVPPVLTREAGDVLRHHEAAVEIRRDSAVGLAADGDGLSPAGVGAGLSTESRPVDQRGAIVPYWPLFEQYRENKEVSKYRRVVERLRDIQPFSADVLTLAAAGYRASKALLSGGQ